MRKHAGPSPQRQQGSSTNSRWGAVTSLWAAMAGSRSWHAMIAPAPAARRDCVAVSPCGARRRMAVTGARLFGDPQWKGQDRGDPRPDDPGPAQLRGVSRSGRQSGRLRRPEQMRACAPSSSSWLVFRRARSTSRSVGSATPIHGVKRRTVSHAPQHWWVHCSGAAVVATDVSRPHGRSSATNACDAAIRRRQPGASFVAEPC